MARKRVSMREGPLAELFRATESSQSGSAQRGSSARPQGKGDAAERRRPSDPGEPTQILTPAPEPVAPPAPVPAPIARCRRSAPRRRRPSRPSRSRSPAGSSRSPRTPRASSVRATALPTLP